MKQMIGIKVAILLLLLLVGCSELDTKLDEKVEVQDPIDIVVTEDEIIDEELPLANPLEYDNRFDLGVFTDLAHNYVNQMGQDIEDNLDKDEDYVLYSDLALVPYNDLMAVVNVELEYLMQFDKGEWSNREDDYPNGNGMTISSFSKTGDVFEYEITYRDNTGSYKQVEVLYNDVLDRFDYYCESYNNDGVLSYVVSQQFCSDGNSGYYYQALRHSILDDMERASFSYFNQDGYMCYAKANSEGIDFESFVIDLFEEVPNNNEDMIKGYGGLSYLQNNELGLSYELVR